VCCQSFTFGISDLHATQAADCPVKWSVRGAPAGAFLCSLSYFGSHKPFAIRGVHKQAGLARAQIALRIDLVQAPFEVYIGNVTALNPKPFSVIGVTPLRSIRQRTALPKFHGSIADPSARANTKS
jgi:hypothetical protein